MVMVTWVGEGERGPKDNEWNGKTFEKGKAVNIDDMTMVEKAKGNRFYKVAGHVEDDPAKDSPEKPSNATLAERAKAELAAAEAKALQVELHGGPAPDALGASEIERKIAANRVLTDPRLTEPQTAFPDANKNIRPADFPPVQVQSPPPVEGAPVVAPVASPVPVEPIAGPPAPAVPPVGATPAPPVAAPVVEPPDPAPEPNPDMELARAPAAAPDPSQRVDVIDVPRSSVIPSA